jgi:hypothetical protein
VGPNRCLHYRISTDADGRVRTAIDDELGQIAACVDTRIAISGVGARDVDMVFLTGGSSFVPAVRRIFETRFGAARIRTGNAFTSVARGLAVNAARHLRMRSARSSASRSDSRVLTFGVLESCAWMYPVVSDKQAPSRRGFRYTRTASASSSERINNGYSLKPISKDIFGALSLPLGCSKPGRSGPTGRPLPGCRRTAQPGTGQAPSRGINAAPNECWDWHAPAG